MNMEWYRNGKLNNNHLMIDRLQQFRNMISYQQTEDDAEDSALTDANPEGIQIQFIDHMKRVKQIILSISNNTYRITHLKSKYSKAIKSADEKTNSQQMNTIINRNSTMIQQIRQLLNKIRTKVEDAEKYYPDEPQTRMKKNFYISLTEELRTMLQKQQTHEEEFRLTVKDKISRQVRFIDKEITQQEIQEYVANPDLAQQMLQKKMYGQASTTLINTVSDIQDKFKDILKLQASVTQCMHLFKELSALVYGQGQLIDSIEANVAECKDYIVKAQMKLSQAKQQHKQTRKFYCKLILGGILLVGVIMGIIFASQ